MEIINLLIWLHIGIFFKLKLLKKKINFLKTHNALITIKNFAFTDIVKTLGLIYIIRDPRDIIISYSNHLNLSYEETFKRMKDLNTVEKTNDQLDRTLLSSWSNHYNSWKYFPSNKLIVRYEDLVTNPLLSFSKIIKYLNKLYELPISDEKIQSSIQNVEFKKLKKLEEKKGFSENPNYNKGKFFFREGKINQGKEILSKDLLKQIEKEFESEMVKNNYFPNTILILRYFQIKFYKFFVNLILLNNRL